MTTEISVMYGSEKVKPNNGHPWSLKRQTILHGQIIITMQHESLRHFQMFKSLYSRILGLKFNSKIRFKTRSICSWPNQES